MSKFHRWLVVAFMLPVVANSIAYSVGEPPAWLVYAPLAPLVLLMATGLYMFVLPHAAGWRRRRSAERGTAA